MNWFELIWIDLDWFVIICKNINCIICDIIKKIKEEYPNANLINCDEITTFQFGSTCKNIILSHASFSAIIGYLSFYSNVYYHKYEENKIWYGDMFSINNWIELQQ